MIDEREWTKEQMIDFLKLLFGGKSIDDLPDPLHDWKNFHTGLTHVVKNGGLVWDPVDKKLKHWIDLKALDRIYGQGGRLRRSIVKDAITGRGDNCSTQADTGGFG